MNGSKRLVVGDEDRRALLRDPLGPGQLDPVERLHERPEPDRVEDGVEDHDGRLAPAGRESTSWASPSVRARNAASQNAR